jgi:sterol 24-C-methyltransferase
MTLDHFMNLEESEHLLYRLRTKDPKEHLEMVQEYTNHFDLLKNKPSEDANTITNHYYNLVTDFYEYGWSTSFHFARMFQGYGFMDSIRFHEHYLALKLGLDTKKRVLDVGCGGNE